jgi:hypothetical protein
VAEKALLPIALVLAPLLLGGCSRDASAGSGEPTAPAPAEALADASCGTAGKAECPTQRWMKANLQAHLRSRDYARLGAALKKLAEVEPKGMEGWAESALGGAEAAARGDEAGVSKSCEGCHKQHRETFRRTLRTQPLL